MLQSEDPVLIFKHSPRCALSGMVKSRIEKSTDPRLRYVLVDVVSQRALSNLIADRTEVRHESPQSFLVVNGELKDVRSHMSINGGEISAQLDATRHSES